MRGDGFFEIPFFEYLRKEGREREEEDDCERICFFWDDFLAFCFHCCCCFCCFLLLMFVCSFFVARKLMRTRGVGCGNASGPTSGTYLTTSSGILYLRY